ncbi:hypothetical protein GCM10023205_03900 [Yinghuangia aomiensis]|uniref:HTH cro/C1-type domain-containing protein n=1 Tax=Yinghuangia aomiensis TaxID=676205 RepID=A0ABP9GTB8_9ACTN
MTEHLDGGRANGRDGVDEAAKAKAELIERLRAAQLRRRLATKRLAELAGLGRTTVSQALNGGTITEATVRLLANTLRLDPHPLLVLLEQAQTPAEPENGHTIPDRGTRKTAASPTYSPVGLQGAVDVQCGPLVQYDLGADAIRAWFHAEERAVLASVEAHERAAPQPAQDSVLNLDDIPSVPGERSRTLDEWAELADRGRAGEDLDEEEQHSLAAWLDICDSAAAALAAFSPLAERPPPDSRTPQQYRNEAAAYMDACRTAMAQEIDQYIDALPPTTVHLVSLTPAYLAGIELELSLPSEIYAVRPPRPAIAAPSIRWPRRPRPYGSTLPRPTAYQSGPRWMIPNAAPSSLYADLHQPFDLSVLDGPHIAHDKGRLTITYNAVDLRANKTVQLPPVVLACTAPGPVTIHWNATAAATDVHGTAHGTVTIDTTTIAGSLAEAALPPREDHHAPQ